MKNTQFIYEKEGWVEIVNENKWNEMKQFIHVENINKYLHFAQIAQLSHEIMIVWLLQPNNDDVQYDEGMKGFNF